ncbi:MAG: ABA4-like family protein, partial [Trueperaceae bacterium]
RGAPRCHDAPMMATLFDASFLLVAPFWLLMIALPGWRVTGRVVASPWIAAPAAALYLALVLPGLPGVLGAVSGPSLEAIAPLLGTPEGATVAWVHFLAFDLFVGRWVYLDARARGVTPWLTSPLLFLTLMLGPAGLLGHLLVRGRYRAA